MGNLKSFREFNDIKLKLASDESFRKEFQQDPVKAMESITISGPVYTSDKLIYRIVIFGFAFTLLFGMLYFIYQYQHSINIRAKHADDILQAIKTLPSVDSASGKRTEDLIKLIGPGNVNATTPDGVIAVFTAIIGALAGLFAPSPLTKSTEAQKA